PALKNAGVRGKVPPRSLALDERSVAQLGHGLLQFCLAIHDDWPVPSNGLLNGLPRNQQEANSLLPGLHRDFIAFVKQHERAVTGRLPEKDLLAINLFLGKHAERPGRRGELAVTFENISKGVTLDFDLERLSHVRRHKKIKIAWIGGHPIDWPFLSPELAADDARTGAVVIHDFRNISTLDVLIARRRHLERRG